MAGLAEKELYVGRGSHPVVCPVCGRPGVMRAHRDGRGIFLTVKHHLTEHFITSRACISRRARTPVTMVCPVCGQEGALRLSVHVHRGHRVVRAWIYHSNNGKVHTVLQRACPEPCELISRGEV